MIVQDKVQRLDERMQGIRDRITKKQEQETILLEDKNSKDWL